MVVFIIILVYLAGAHVMNFISVACGCYLMDFEGLIENLFWPVLLPVALFRRFILKKQLTSFSLYDIIKSQKREREEIKMFEELLEAMEMGYSVSIEELLEAAGVDPAEYEEG